MRMNDVATDDYICHKTVAEKKDKKKRAAFSEPFCWSSASRSAANEEALNCRFIYHRAWELPFGLISLDD